MLALRRSTIDLVLPSLIPDDATQGELLRHADPALVARQRYGCGCFWLRAPP